MQKIYDLIVIGTGAGLIVLDEALKQGLQCAVIEKGKFGGTCLNRGCIPTKVLTTAANYFRAAEHFQEMGLSGGPVKIDWPVLAARVKVKLEEYQATRDYYRQFANLDVYEGHAAFLNERELEISLNEGCSKPIISGRTIVIATGAYTKLPGLKGREEAGYLTSESFFGTAFPVKPFARLVIAGGGPIGCEMAHIFSAAGTQVTILQHNVRLLPKEDAEISAALLTALRKNGIDVRLNVDLDSVVLNTAGKIIAFHDRATGEKDSVQTEEIFYATGVAPAITGLGLENTGIKVDASGWIMTNEFLETTVNGVYALGDINGGPAFRHRANYEADILAHNLFVEPEPQKWRWARYDLVPAVTFTYPEVAHVGLTEVEARAEGYRVKVGKNYYANTAKGYALGITERSDEAGLVKLVVNEDNDEILGAHIIGVEAALLLQPLINLLNLGPMQLVPRNPEIASPAVQELRREGMRRELQPKGAFDLGQVMTPHPSLAEVVMWTQYYLQK